ncbi:MAG: acetate kinase [Solirubrobacteraceae bacterium]|nr:acetate kinase [Solirubrobacteraceae bacterium]
MRILVVNAGSSSLKLRLLGPDDALLADTDIAAPRAEVDEAALADRIGDMGAVDAVGHRIVHGGERFRGPIRIDADVVDELRALTDLAPLHQPKSLAALAVVRRALPDTPAVACFDTAFHATLPPAAATYAVPASWRERWGVRRYGFHGLSHAYAARRAAEMCGARRVVTCHLGAGASLAAVRDGRSVDTTMGFTPLEGLVMATRSGSVDPGLLLWLLERERLTVAEMAGALEHESGLLALAGTADMREILGRSDDAARLAVDVYAHRLRAGIPAMAAALGGMDALVFTGGVGERAPAVRASAADGLSFFGLALDRELNDTVEGDADVSAPHAAVRSLVIRSREDLEIARQVRVVLG